MDFGITFAPLVPAYVLWAAVALAVVLAALLALRAQPRLRRCARSRSR